MTDTSPVSSLTVTSCLALLMSRMVTLTTVVSETVWGAGFFASSARAVRPKPTSAARARVRIERFMGETPFCLRAGRSLPAQVCGIYRHPGILARRRNADSVASGGDGAAPGEQEWRKRVGVEPTRRPFR